MKNNVLMPRGLCWSNTHNNYFMLLVYFDTMFRNKLLILKELRCLFLCSENS